MTRRYFLPSRRAAVGSGLFVAGVAPRENVSFVSDSRPAGSLTGCDNQRAFCHSCKTRAGGQTRTNGRGAIRKEPPATDFRLYTFRLCQQEPGQKDSRPGTWMRKTRAWLESVAKSAIDSLVKQGNDFQNPCALKRSDRPAFREACAWLLGDAMPIASLPPSVSPSEQGLREVQE